MKKRFGTRSYKLQVLLTQVEEIKVVDVVKKKWEGRITREIVFEFDVEKGRRVYEIVSKFKEDKTMKVDNFDELKAKRKQLIDEYLNNKQGDRDDC